MRIGIRREDKNQWERRVPLTPDHVARLLEAGLEVSIQPSGIRVFSDQEYAAAGAAVVEDLDHCDLVLAVKEIPEIFFRDGGVYMFFAHVCKGQSHNMPMLRRILDRRATLIDHERVTDDEGRRLVFFGYHAGAAGIIETLYTLGRRFEWEGTPTPLSALKRPLELESLEKARALLGEVGDRIAEGGLPDSLAPFVVGFTGYGNVSQGAQAFFDLLPHEEVAPERLAAFVTGAEFSSRKIYKVVFKEWDIVVPRRDGGEFDLHEYYEHSERYRCVFERYLPHLTALVNCIYWDPRYSRLVTKEWLRATWSAPERPKLRVFGDITCDIDGSIECTVKATEPGEPNYTYLPSEDRIVNGWEGEGPVVMAVETLPAEVPREASSSFGDMLTPFLGRIAAADFGSSFDRLVLPAAIQKAVIVHQGEFTPDYQYVSEFVSNTVG